MERKLQLEAEYLVAWQNGEPEGFAYFYTAYKAALVVFATGFVKSREVAEDLVQECLVKLWQKKPRIAHAAAIKSYFYRTVYHSCLSYLRDEGRRSEIRKGLPLEEEEPGFFQGMVRAETLRHLYAAVKQLPPQCARIVHMYYDEGKEYGEIAEELKLSISTVRNQRRKGIELLKKKFPNMVWWGIALAYFIGGLVYR